MATLIQRAAFADVRHHPVTTAILAAGFWAAAAVLVATCHVELDRFSRSGAAAAAIASIVVIAFAYINSSARNAGIDHALGVGIAWLVLAIVAEIVISRRTGHAWFGLIGPPDRPLLRNVFLFVWMFAPSLFARPQPEG